MNPSGNILIVGGDSIVGGGLAARLSGGGMTVSVTTRRRPAGEKIYFELSGWKSFAIPGDVDAAVLCAGVSGFAACETNSESEQINAVFLPALAERLLANGVFTVFLSSSAVFADNLPLPGENAPTCPGTAYGRQKAIAEEKMRADAEALGAAHCAVIVRLTRAFDAWKNPIAAWRENWRDGQKVRAFSDVLVSPITLDYLSDALGRVITERKAGVWHLSGETGVSYAELCSRLAGTFGAGAGQIEITTADASGVYAPFRPADGALGMARTTEALGIRPQTLDDVLDCVAGQVKKGEE